MQKFIEKYRVDFFFVLLLLLCGIKFTSNISTFIDLPYSDEGSYLEDAVRAPENGFKPAYWGTLYTFWYYCLLLIFKNAVTAFYTNVTLLTLFPTLLLYVFLRINKVSATKSLLAAFMYLISFNNLYVFHKGNQFAYSILLVGLCTASYFRRHPIFFFILALFVFIISFARPEMVLAFYMLSLAYVFVHFKSTVRLHWFTWKPVLFSTLLVVLSVIAWQALLKNESRSYYTFSSNFPVNWVQWNNLSLDPDQNHQMLTQEAFGDAKTLGQALNNNPRAFCKHVLYNFKTFIEVFIRLFFCHFNLILPASNRFFTLLEGLLIALLAVAVLYKNRDKMPEFRSQLNEHKWFLVSVAIMLVPCGVANFIFYPRFNYVLLPVNFSFLVIGVLFLANWKPSTTKLVYMPILSLLLLAATPTLSSNWYFASADKQNNADKTTLKNIVDIIDNLNLQQPTKIFVAEKSIFLYNSKLENIDCYYSKQDFPTFKSLVDGCNIKIIVVTNYLLSNQMVREMHGFDDYLKNPSDFGFEKIPVPNSSSFLLVHHSLGINH